MSNGSKMSWPDMPFGLVGASAVLGLAGILGLTKGSMRPEEKEAFEKLDLSCMTPKQMWLAGCDYGQAPLLDIRRGLQDCVRMSGEENPPALEVRAAIWAHWLSKAGQLLGAPVTKSETYEALLAGELEIIESRWKEKTP